MNTDSPHASCCARVADGSGFHFYNCGKRAKTTHEGKPYCGIHDPERLAAIRAKNSAKWEADYAAKQDEKQKREDAAFKARLTALLSDPRVKEEMARAAGHVLRKHTSIHFLDDTVAQVCIDALARMVEGV